MSEGGALRELAAFFGFEFDHAALEKANGAINGLKEKATSAAAAIGAAFVGEQVVRGILNFTESQIRAGSELEVMSRRLGMTSDDLQLFQFAAGESGVATESMTTGLRFLNRNLAEAAEGSKEAAGVFAGLKIAVKDNGETRKAADVFGDLADRIAGIEDPAKRVEVAMKLLGRGGADLIPLLAGGRAAFDEARQSMAALGGGMSRDFVKQAHEAEVAQFQLNFALNGFKSEAAEHVIPIFRDIVLWLAKQTGATREWLKDTNVMREAMEALAVASGVGAVMGITKLLSALGLLRPSLIKTIAAVWEFALPAIAVAILAVAFEDLWTMMHGGRSVIGDLLDDLFGIGTAASVAQDLVDTWGHFTSVLETIGDVAGNVATIITEVLGGAFDIAAERLMQLRKAIDDLKGGHVGAALGDLTMPGKGFVDDIKEHIAAIKHAGKDIGVDVSGNRAGSYKSGDKGAQVYIPKEIRAVFTPRNAPLGSAAPMGHVREPRGFVYGHGAHGGHVVHQSNTFHTTVHTASDQPRAVGEAVGQGVSTEAQRATANALAATKST